MQSQWNAVVDAADCMGSMLGAASSKFLELGGLAKGHKVLDLGCGTGSLAARAAAIVGAGGRVVGIDTCPEMVATAASVNAGPEYAVRDACDPLGENVFDAILCRFSLPFLGNPYAAMASSFAALRPGGRLCIMSIADHAHNDFIGVLEGTGSPLVGHAMQWGDERAISSALESVGFRSALTKRIRALVTVANPAEYWDCARGLFGFTQPAMPRELAARLAPGTRLNLSIVFAVGRKPDPAAPIKHDIQTGDDAIALARRRTREVGPTSLAQLFKGEQVVYLDVRAPGARVSQIKGSLNVTRDELEARLPALVPDPASVIVVYCQHGNQSALATAQLRALGYTNVWSLQRGIEAWEYVGMKTVPA